MKNVFTYGFIAFILLACIDENKKTLTKMNEESQILLSSPSSLGIDSLLLQKMTEKIENQEYPNLHSLLILKDGKLIYEEYFKGQDYSYGKDLGVVQHSDVTLHDVRSISKSVVSICVGIALDKGYIDSVEQKVSIFFPEHISLFKGRKADWSIYDFLTMTTGLDWNERIPYTSGENDEVQLSNSKNPIEYILSKDLVDSTERLFNYNGGATQVLAHIIEKTSNIPIDEFAKKHLFSPMGINNFEWQKYHGSGKISAASGLRLTSRGLLKIGLLYRSKGLWDGQQIISRKWVEDSFKKHVTYPSMYYDGDDYYGYQFWIWDDKIGNQEFKVVSANGNGDQNIYWDIKNDLIIVNTAGNYNNWDIENTFYNLVKNEIYPLLGLK